MALAFAEIELHEYDRGLRNIEASLRGFARNAHAAHIRAHLFYELGEREAGLDYLDDWSRGYSPDGQMHCHITWHRALWSLETGRRERAWGIYRTALKPGAAWGPPLNVLTDCASFLLRAEMAGETVEPALWIEIADFAARWFPNSGIVFADIHSALAFAMAGKREALQRIIDNPRGSAADILLPIALGFDAFAGRLGYGRRRDRAGAGNARAPCLLCQYGALYEAGSGSPGCGAGALTRRDHG